MRNYEQIANMYPKEMDYDELLNEWWGGGHLMHYMALDDYCETKIKLFRTI